MSSSVKKRSANHQLKILGCCSLGHYCIFNNNNLNIVTLTSNFRSETLLIFDFHETLQHNFVLGFHNHQD